MSAFIVAALRILFLALIWAFILLAGSVIRTDIFGQRVDADGQRVRGRRRGLRRARQEQPEEAPVEAAVPVANRLVVTEGRQAGATYPLQGVMGLGRAASSAVHVDDDYSSSRHAELVPSGDGWLVQDLNSTNGTYVNGSQISQPTPVGPGDVIRIGRTQLRLEA